MEGGAPATPVPSLPWVSSPHRSQRRGSSALHPLSKLAGVISGSRHKRMISVAFRAWGRPGCQIPPPIQAPRSQVALGNVLACEVSLRCHRFQEQPQSFKEPDPVTSSSLAGGLPLYHHGEVQLRGKLRSQVQLGNEERGSKGFRV